MATRRALKIDTNHSIKIAANRKSTVQRAVLGFLDAAATGTGRSTFYNTKEEQEAAIKQLHEQVFSIDRGLYAALMLLPGSMEYSKQHAVVTLLSHRYTQGILTEDQEKAVLRNLADDMSITYLLRMFKTLRDQRVNNERTKKLILTLLLGNKNTSWWAIKYRTKMQQALSHAYGVRQTGILRSILSKNTWNTKEQSIVSRLIDRFALDKDQARDAVAFIFGATRNYTHDVFKAFEAAKTNLEAGSKLPTEVLEGIRGRYHKSVDKGQVLELTKKTMTDERKMRVQRNARALNAQVDFDPKKIEAVKLYQYAFGMGMTDEIRAALDEKGKDAARTLPFGYGNIEIIVDCSKSMEGKADQKMRAASIAHATADMIAATAEHSSSVYAGGERLGDRFYKPRGATNLAKDLVTAIKMSPDAIFIITDGYENIAAGRVAEVIDNARKLGFEAPIYQLNPVLAAESAGVRQLSSDVKALPVAQPSAMGLTLTRGVLEHDIEAGLSALLTLALPRINVEALTPTESNAVTA